MEGRRGAGPRAGGAHLPPDQPPRAAQAGARQGDSPSPALAWFSTVHSGISQYPRLRHRTICRQHANCFNLISDPSRGSPRAAGAMDFVQEQLKRGRKADPAARPSQTLEDSRLRSSQGALGRGPSHPFQLSLPLPSLPLKGGISHWGQNLGTRENNSILSCIRASLNTKVAFAQMLLSGM